MASGCITRDQLLEWLSSARGKDKLFRLVGYTSYFVSDSKLFLSLIASAESSEGKTLSMEEYQTDRLKYMMSGECMCQNQIALVS